MSISKRNLTPRSRLCELRIIEEDEAEKEQPDDNDSLEVVGGLDPVNIAPLDDLGTDHASPSRGGEPSLYKPSLSKPSLMAH